MLLQCGVYVDVPGVLKETPLHLAAKNGFKDLVDVLVQSGGNVNARNFPMQETPLHLATRNGHRHIAQFLVQQGSQVNARNNPSRETPLHLASRNGHQQIAEFLIRRGSQVNARNVPWQETPLHWALKNGHPQIAQFLKQHGGLAYTLIPFLSPLAGNGYQIEFALRHRGVLISTNIPWRAAKFLMQDVAQDNSRNISVQETPLHKGTQNGRQQIAESLVQQEGYANASNVPMQETSLHRAEKNGHQPAAEFLILKRSQDHARILPMRETPLHLVSQNGCQAIQTAVPGRGIQVHAGKVETPFHWATNSSPRHISFRKNENYLLSQLVARNGQHRGPVNAKNSSLQANFLNLASRTGRRHIAESTIRRGIEIIAKDIQRQETSFIQQGSGINAGIYVKEVLLHGAVRNETKRCRQKNLPELVVRRLSQVSVSSLVQSKMSIRKEKLLTHAFSSLSDSESFSSSDRKTSRVLSCYTTVLCVDGKCGKDGINRLLINIFCVIIVCCVGLCLVFVALSLSFFRRNKTTMCFPRHCIIPPLLGNTTRSDFKCIPTIELMETITADQCVTETADNEALGDKGCTQTVLTKKSASELFERKFFPEVLTSSYQQLDKDKSVRRLRMELVLEWLEYSHDQDVLSSMESEGNACVEFVGKVNFRIM